MCRQLLSNKEGIKLIEQEYGGIENYIEWLIKERGGNGNGLVLVKDGKIVQFNKATEKFSSTDIAEILKTHDYDWVLFHTRLASVGDVTRSNCHPFIYSDKFAIAMNGTEDEYSLPTPEDIRANETDTERLASALFRSGESPEKFLQEHSNDSVFFGFRDGQPYVFVNDPSILKVLKPGEKSSISAGEPIVFASDFPWSFDGKDIYEFDAGRFYWENGRDLPEKKMKNAPDGKRIFSDVLKDKTVIETIKANPEIRGIFSRIISQFEKIYDTAETIYAQQLGIPQEEVSHDMTLNQFLDENKKHDTDRGDE